MGEKMKLDHIAGWPKMIINEPDRPHLGPWELFGTDLPDEQDETDEPYDISNVQEYIYEQTENIYAVLSTFVKFQSRGLYPPPWVLNQLAVVFNKHLNNPDPDLFASQVGVTGKGSGVANPFDDYTRGRERHSTLTEMVMLVNGFRISLTDAARAVILRDCLHITEKTLTNDFRQIFGSPKPWMLKHRKYDPLHDPFLGEDENREGFISEFPRKVQKLLRQNMPDIT